jgi:transitional endoplasmic reticulum ATPase
MGETLDERSKRTKVQIAEVEKIGEKIILPVKMSTDEAINQLMRLKKREEEVVTVSQVFDAFPWDGAYALTLALKKLFGWYSLEKTPTFFGPKPPEMRTIDISATETVQIPWGRFSIPCIPGDEGFLQTGATTKNNRLVFSLGGSVRRKYEEVFLSICTEIKAQLAINSIYKGKAFKLRFLDDKGTPLEMPEPQFMRLNPDTITNLVLPRKVHTQVKTNLFTPLEQYAKLKAVPLPFKRGVLLAGPFGTGKTMICSASAIKAVESNITFILCLRAEEFNSAIEFAAQYAPALVFCEDIDRVTSGDRTVKMDDILNTIDGIESKRREVMVVLTTNNVEVIHRAMLRPGRLDSVIEVTPPDAEAVERLIHVYAKGQINPDADLKEVGVVLAGQVPAVIQECVHRAKLYALLLDPESDPKKLEVTADALLGAAEGMAMQLGLLNGKQSTEVPPEVMAMNVLGFHLTQAVKHIGKGIEHNAPDYSREQHVSASRTVKELTSHATTRDGVPVAQAVGEDV